MYLVDTNIWLERLLDQARSGEVGHFLNHIPSERLFITDEKYNLALVSFDSDFDHTERGRKTPAEVLQG